MAPYCPWLSEAGLPRSSPFPHVLEEQLPPLLRVLNEGMNQGCFVEMPSVISGDLYPSPPPPLVVPSCSLGLCSTPHLPSSMSTGPLLPSRSFLCTPTAGARTAALDHARPRSPAGEAAPARDVPVPGLRPPPGESTALHADHRARWALPLPPARSPDVRKKKLHRRLLTSAVHARATPRPNRR